MMTFFQGTKVRLSADVVSSLDPDTPPEELVSALFFSCSWVKSEEQKG